MREPKRNLPALVLARLLKRAHETGDDYQIILANYCFERFLYRLGMSELRDRFVLKGAMLLRLWSENPYRSTRDLDLLRKGEGSSEGIREDLKIICAVAVQPDAVSFSADGIRVEAIRAEDEYAGTRVILPARCGTARLPLQIDIGIGDSVWPEPQRAVFPTLLDFPPPEVLAYSRESVVAEKFEAMVVLGDRNSRIRDFFDLHHLASRCEFDRLTLAEAVRRTFSRRQTPIPMETPIGLTSEYWRNPSRPSQVRAFVRRAGLTVSDEINEDFMKFLGAFLLPILDDLRGETLVKGAWPPGGPWRR
jgi:predicted nucleotidyltransferase component of viral defense system